MYVILYPGYLVKEEGRFSYQLLGSTFHSYLHNKKRNPANNIIIIDNFGTVITNVAVHFQKKILGILMNIKYDETRIESKHIYTRNNSLLHKQK